MKTLLTRLTAKRWFWFCIGVVSLPILSFLYSLAFPTAKRAMGFVGFYEENKAIYTFLGDHTYSLSFPGDERRFHQFAKRLGLAKHKTSDTTYSEEGKDWTRKVTFDSEDTLRSIQFYSQSH